MTNRAPNSLAETDSLRVEAFMHLRAQRWADAADCLHSLVVADPQDAGVRQWQVIAAIVLGQPELAVEAAQAALQSLPASDHVARADVFFNLGQALALLGRREEALAAFDQALTLNPTLDCVEPARDRLLAQSAPAGGHA